MIGKRKNLYFGKSKQALFDRIQERAKEMNRSFSEEILYGMEEYLEGSDAEQDVMALIQGLKDDIKNINRRIEIAREVLS